MRDRVTARARKYAASLFGLLFAVGIVVGCSGSPAGAETENAPGGPLPVSTTSAGSVSDYLLGTGDKLRVIVFGEPDLSGEFDITAAGKVSLPLIGQVQAAGLTLDQFEKEVADNLANGYLTNPKVSVEVLNYRPFYIIGEVDKPGQYPYTNGMTILNAVAVGGGYTYRANTDSVYITRGDGEEIKYPANQAVRVLPGDVVRVPERFF